MQIRLKQVVLTVAVLVPVAAMARAVPASSGRPQYWSEGSCFNLGYSAVSNSCSARRAFEIPLTVDAAGSKTVVVTAYGATSANNVGCFAMGVNREVTLIWGGARKWLPAFGSAQYITLTDAYVPAAGFLFVNCHLDYGGQVNNVDHTP